MKIFSGLLVCLLLIAGSCKKDEISDPGLLGGNWKWVYSWSDGPMGPTNPRTPQNTGNEESIIFNPDFTYEHSMYGYAIEDLPTARGTFSIGHSSYTPYKGAYAFAYDSIVYYPNNVFSQRFVDYFKVSNDTLVFSSSFKGVSGGGSRTYIKTGV